ncbi:MAG: 4Fe-4S dicluster domain-containing protein [Candidatus Bathyarchaeota archaeon]|nr:4Fe-4S dicluster domain-containing protein [Candidatus Bathyarchaeota archaeon]
MAIDSDKCDGCGKCIEKCPASALVIVSELIDLEDKLIASVNEKNRKKIKYTCSTCRPENKKTPCTEICDKKAISIIWKTN